MPQVQRGIGAMFGIAKLSAGKEGWDGAEGLW